MLDSSENFRAAFEAVPGSCLLLQPDAPAYTVVAITDELLGVLGLERQHVVGKSIFTVFPENPALPQATGAAELRTSLEYARQEKAHHHMPVVRYDIAAAAGVFEERYWSANSKPVVSPAGEVLYIIHATAEVTAQLLAEKKAQALRQVEKTYSLFLQAPVAVCIVTGPQHIVELANDEIHQFLGTTPAIIGKPLFEALPAAKAQGFPKLLDQVRTTGQPFYGTEYPVTLTLNGREELRYYNFVYQPYYEQPTDKAPVGVFSVAHNVTEQVLSRQRAEESEHRYRTLIEEAPIATAFYTGPEVRIQYVNAIMLSYWGKDRTVIGSTLREALPELADHSFPALLEHVYTTGEPYVGVREATTLLVDGKSKISYFNFTYKPLRNEHGDVYGIHHTAIDVTEEVLAQQKIEESEARFRNLVAQAPVPIALTIGPNMVFANVNEPMQQMVGRRSVAFVGKTMREIFPELENQAAEQLARRAQEKGEPFYGTEMPVTLQIGNETRQGYYDLSYTPLREKGQITGVIHVAVEVTEQVQARRRLEESQEELKRFKFMADQARDPFVLMRADGTFAYLNKQALDSWGYTAEEARHLHVQDIDSSYPYQAYVEVFGRAQNGSFPRFNSVLKRKDGHTYPVSVSMSGLVLGGEPYLFAIPRDSTEQKKFTDTLQESEQRFRIMADAAPNLVWAMHPDSAIRYVNTTFLEFLGTTLGAFVATNWETYVHPEDAAAAQRTISSAIEERTRFRIEYRMRRHDGQYRWLLSQGAPSYYPSGELYGYVGSAIDITELKEANQQLLRTNNDLDNFVYTASHDLKAPIANIEGLLHALQRTPPTETLASEQVLRLTEMMQESVERFKKTIATLTDVAKLQKEHDGESVLIDLATVVEDVRLDLTPMIASVGAQVEIDVAACPTIRFSEKNLRSVVYNLFSNALKYHSPERTPHVRIRCESTPEHQVLVIQDNGLGMEAGRQQQLFTMFKRFHDHVEGSGIGLYMVKKMVDNAGGRIEVETQVKQGSTFRVYFRR